MPITVREIEEILFQWAPHHLAASWDNVGHLIGRREKQVDRVLVALDVTAEVVSEAVKGDFDLIISHHPVMNCAWHPVQTLRDDDLQGRILMELVHKDIAVICMHTNLDAADGGVNDMLCERLGLENTEKLGDEDGIARMGVLSEPMALSAFLPLLRKRLRPNGLRYCQGRKNVSRVAVGGGACADMFRLVAERGCDTFVTSDVKYHQFLDAAELGLNLIDAGHFPTEDPICYAIVNRLSEVYPDIKFVKSDSHREIIQYYM